MMWESAEMSFGFGISHLFCSGPGREAEIDRFRVVGTVRPGVALVKGSASAEPLFGAPTWDTDRVPENIDARTLIDELRIDRGPYRPRRRRGLTALVVVLLLAAGGAAAWYS